MENKKISLLKVFGKTLLLTLKVFRYIFMLIFIVVCIIFLSFYLQQKPSNIRDWEPQDAILPKFSWSGNTVTINNIRNHKWKDENNFDPNYFSESYNLDEIKSVDYIITPFSNFRGPAHIMLSFGFENNKRVVISAEIRKERGESFDIIKGILNQYELQYVIATEEDVIKLRTNYRKNPVIMYPIRANKEDIAGVFRSMIIRSEKLSKEPEFYNTIYNNCTTSVIYHANAFRNKKIKWNHYMILPENSDKILFEENMVDTDLDIESARKFFNISEKAKNIKEGENFSEIIRKK